MDILTTCTGKLITSAASVSRSQSHSGQDWKTFFLFVAPEFSNILYVHIHIRYLPAPLGSHSPCPPHLAAQEQVL